MTSTTILPAVPRTLLAALITGAAAVASAPAAAQPLAPEQALGLRAQAARGVLAPDAAIVVVDSPGAFVEAVGTLWSAGHVVPILIDDGSPAAREDIARFVRALRTPAARPALLTWAGAKADLPADRLVRDAALQRTLRAVWKATDDAGLLAAYAARENAPANTPTGPLGVVAYDPLDPAAPAAFALAAFYGQVLVPITAPVAPATELWSVAKVDALAKVITSRLDELKVTSRAMGDQVDAVTLCLTADPRVTTKGEFPGNGPITSKNDDSIALTDLLGRTPTGNRVSRWAYASQLTGSSPRAVYRAMCSMFLRKQRTSALVIDTYETGGQWAEFDGAKTAEAFKPGLPGGVTLLDPARFGLADWRTLAAGSFASPRSPGTPADRKGGGVESPLITVTTMGNWDFFQMRPGSGEPGDIPLLRTPGAVYFVHSWSMQMGDRPDTVGGRWLDKGAYSYVGSVHEPYLLGFVPTPLFADRMVKGWPIAAAARHSAPPVNSPWRIQVMGDALMTLAGGPTTSTTTTTIGATAETIATSAKVNPVADTLRAALKAKDFAAASKLLILQGRDADALRLAKALLGETPALVTPEIAEGLALSAYREGDLETFLTLAEKADPSVDVPNELADAIWHALGTRLDTLSAERAQLLARNVRLWNLARDAFEAGRAVAKVAGASAGLKVLEDAMQRTKRPEVQQKLQASIPLIK